jgi:hypothetical protein
VSFIISCDNYLASRTGRYEWRSIRYHKALDWLKAAGLHDCHTLFDVGAGWTEFDYALRTYGGSKCRYIPVDGGIDGTNLELWTPPRMADWFVCLEVLEHLENPFQRLERMEDSVERGGGILLSTPNPATTDVLGMDPTHKTPIWDTELMHRGYQVEAVSFYGQPKDSLFATWRKA